jgi:hypothetical protein
MASFFQSLWESIFTPGPTPSLLLATNVTFGCLQIVLAVLLAATYSVHFVVLSGLCAALWWAINWFARELKASQKAEQDAAAALAERKAAAPAGGVRLTRRAGQALSEDSETEIDEGAAGSSSVSTRPGGQLPADVPGSLGAELTHRPVGASASGDESATGMSQGTKSNASTEDEWEKVSESENDKDK